MAILLRLAMAGFYITLGAMVFLHPESTQHYIDARLQGFYGLVHSVPQLAKVPLPTLAALPHLPFEIVGGFFGLTGLCALFGMRCAFTFFSLLAVALGAILHCPYKSIEEKVPTGQQVRKLMFVFAVLCATVAFPCGKSEEGKKPAAAAAGKGKAKRE